MQGDSKPNYMAYVVLNVVFPFTPQHASLSLSHHPMVEGVSLVTTDVVLGS